MSGGTGLLILTQVASRALTFIGNQIVLRYSSPTLLGIAVQLELVSVTVLYFARESLRVALQRQPRPVRGEQPRDGKTGEDKHALQGAINTSYLAAILGTLVLALSFRNYRVYASDEVTGSPSFAVSYQCYALATALELYSEPAFVVIQQAGLYRARAAAETRAAIARCLVACAAAVIERNTARPASTLPFATGQLAYGATLALLYNSAAWRAVKGTKDSLKFTDLPSTKDDKTALIGSIPVPLLTLALTLYAQSTFKLLLTQGDALLLSLVAPLASQGAFALASNYSGLLARLVFQPVEESSRNIFGALLNSPTPSTASSNGSAATSSSRDPISKGSDPDQPSPPDQNITTALKHLSITLHTYLLLTLPLLTLAPSLLPAITPIILSPQWRSPATTSLLQSYIYYLPLLALNGILDAFVTSVASTKQLNLQSLGMLGFTGLYGLCCWVFLRVWDVGPKGLVWAGAVTMAGRCVWGAVFLSRWITVRHDGMVRRRGAAHTDDGKEGKREGSSLLTTNAAFWRAATPRPLSIAGTAVVWMGLSVALWGSNGQVQSLKDLQQVGYVVTAAVVLASTLVGAEAQFLRQLVQEVLPSSVAGRLPMGLRKVLGV